MHSIQIFWLIEGSNGIVLYRRIKWYSSFLLVAWRIRNMTIAFQLAVFALIATSSILLISVPVVFASPEGWSSNKNVVFSGTSLWIGLVFLVGILNSLIS
nr:photosystem II protein Z [Picrasma quassioides]UXX49996.1 photosystem II protein Z [Picrasma quassioides]